MLARILILTEGGSVMHDTQIERKRTPDKKIDTDFRNMHTL